MTAEQNDCYYIVNNKYVFSARLSKTGFARFAGCLGVLIIMICQ